MNNFNKAELVTANGMSTADYEAADDKSLEAAGDGTIICRLDRVMADRKISLNELAAGVGISNVNLSKLKTGKVTAIRFSTLAAICKALDCQPGDILEYRP